MWNNVKAWNISVTRNLSLISMVTKSHGTIQERKPKNSNG